MARCPSYRKTVWMLARTLCAKCAGQELIDGHLWLAQDFNCNMSRTSETDDACNDAFLGVILLLCCRRWRRAASRCCQALKQRRRTLRRTGGRTAGPLQSCSMAGAESQCLRSVSEKSVTRLFPHTILSWG